MNKEKVSLISSLVNLVLAVFKVLAGVWFKSSALVADGIHSGLDIFSSFITYLGIYLSKKPADKEHPYGYFRYETIAGFAVTFLLLVSSFGIIYEGVVSLIKNQSREMGISVLVIAAVSVIVNEIMARLKFKVGERENNLALIADAKHSRADSLSSVGVLIGVFFSFWFSLADALTAILVGFYILYETWSLGREVTDNLLDISNPALEEKIKKICRQEEINLIEIKTRKIGTQNFAELKIGLNVNWRLEKAEEVIKSLEKILLEKIKDLEFVAIQVVSHKLKDKYIKMRSHEAKCYKAPFKKVKLEKKGFRTIIPLKENKLCSTFGAPEYMVIDKDKKGNLILKKKIKNPYFRLGKGHGMKFVKDVKPNKIIAREIGEKSKKELEKLGIEIELRDKNFKI